MIATETEPNCITERQFQHKIPGNEMKNGEKKERETRQSIKTKPEKRMNKENWPKTRVKREKDLALTSINFVWVEI